MNDYELLAEYARLMNIHGMDSEQVKVFIRQHNDNSEFVELAELSRTLKRVLNKRPADQGPP